MWHLQIKIGHIWVLIAGIAVLVATTIYLILIIALPSKVFVERSVVVNARQTEAYHYLEDLRNFREWAYWAEIDPLRKYEYEGSLKGVGSRMNWHSENLAMGYGSWWIISATPYEQVKCKIQLREFAKPATMEFNFSKEEGHTKISWNLQTDFYGHWKFYVSMMDPELGPAFEKGLLKIQRTLENQSNHGRLKLIRLPKPYLMAIALVVITRNNTNQTLYKLTKNGKNYSINESFSWRFCGSTKRWNGMDKVNDEVFALDGKMTDEADTALYGRVTYEMMSA